MVTTATAAIFFFFFPLCAQAELTLPPTARLCHSRKRVHRRGASVCFDCNGAIKKEVIQILSWQILKIMEQEADTNLLTSGEGEIYIERAIQGTLACKVLRVLAFCKGKTSSDLCCSLLKAPCRWMRRGPTSFVFVLSCLFVVVYLPKLLLPPRSQTRHMSLKPYGGKLDSECCTGWRVTRKFWWNGEKKFLLCRIRVWVGSDAGRTQLKFICSKHHMIFYIKIFTKYFKPMFYRHIHNKICFILRW